MYSDNLCSTCGVDRRPTDLDGDLICSLCRLLCEVVGGALGSMAYGRENAWVKRFSDPGEVAEWACTMYYETLRTEVWDLYHLVLAPGSGCKTEERTFIESMIRDLGGEVRFVRRPKGVVASLKRRIRVPPMAKQAEARRLP